MRIDRILVLSDSDRTVNLPENACDLLETILSRWDKTSKRLLSG